MVEMVEPPREPSMSLSAPIDLLAGYLDFYRDAVLRKIDGMSDADLRRSRVPSGWTPLELVKHLAYVERRWMRWGFVAEQVDQPWGDDDPTRPGRWLVRPQESAEQVIAFFRDQCARSRAIARAAQPGDLAAVGGRFKPGEERPTLVWTVFHLLQEYTRHVGHLDVARELADGTVGE